MGKKIISVSLVILIFAVILTACKNTNEPKEPESTDKVVETVTLTGKDGGTTVVEIYENSSGDRYITNTDGDKVPLTSDKDGFVDDIGYIVTLKPTEGSSTSAPSSTNPKESNSANPTESKTGGIVIVDSGETFVQDSIAWEDIKNPKN